MDIRQLYYFRALAKNENYTKTANEIFITQPSLSYAISSMEKELDVRLFERSGRNVVLTPQGQIFVRHVQIILDEYERALDAVHTCKGSSKQRLVIASTGFATGMRLINRFRESCREPELDISYSTLHSSQIYKGLLNNSIDVGITYHEISDSRFEQLQIPGLDMVLITPPDHPLATNDVVPFQEVAQKYAFIRGQTPILHDFFLRARDVGISCQFIGEGTDSFNVARMVASGMGISVVSLTEEIKSLPIKIIRFTGFENKTYRYLCRVQQSAHSPVAERFWTAIAATLPQP